MGILSLLLGRYTQKEVDDIHKIYEKEINELKTDYNSKLDKGIELIERRKQELSNSQKENERKIQLIKKDYEDKMSKHTKEINELKNKLNEQLRQSNINLYELKNKLNQDFETRVEEKELELNKKYQFKMNELNSGIEVKEKDFKDIINKIENEKAQYLDKLNKDYEFKVNKLNLSIKIKEKELNDMMDLINNDEKEFAKRMKQKEQELDNRLIKLEEEKQAYIDKLNKDYEFKIKEFKKISSQKENMLINKEKSINKLKNKMEFDKSQLNKKKDKLSILHKGLKEKEKAVVSLSNNELNETMLSIYNECFTNNLKDLKEFFETKKNPSKKASEFISEFKEYIRELEIDNRKLRLALSQYVDGIEGYNEVVKQRRLEGLKEYNNLSEVEKKERKLQREQQKVKDQLEIGYAFERYYGYLMESKDYSVDYWGIKNGKSDGGIDLVAKNKKEIVYIQCKYWSKKTEIRENVISQLYGASLNLALQNGTSVEQFTKEVKEGKIKMILATHTILSKEAREFANRLGVIYEENIEMVDYPMVKLVEGEDKIYYIPTDEQYDTIIYKSTGKKYGRCSTCQEAESMGYRGAKRWIGYL